MVEILVITSSGDKFRGHQSSGDTILRIPGTPYSILPGTCVNPVRGRRTSPETRRSVHAVNVCTSPLRNLAPADLKKDASEQNHE